MIRSEPKRKAARINIETKIFKRNSIISIFEILKNENFQSF
jgi:hypothetical protein